MNFIRNIGTTEIVIIAVLIVLFFGRKKLNELVHGLGESKRELKEIKETVKGDKGDAQEVE